VVMPTSKTLRTRTGRSAVYRMIQEKISIFWKWIVLVIVIKKYIWTCV